MELKTCEYCKSTFTPIYPNTKYCPGKKCANRMNKIKKTLRQKAFYNTLEPRICKRCEKPFHFPSMKKHCQECVDFLKEKPSHYKKEMKMKKSNLCIKCKKKEKHSTSPNAKYCIECVIKVKKEKVKKLNENRKAEYRKNVIEIKKKKKDGINPYFLKRKQNAK